MDGLIIYVFVSIFTPGPNNIMSSASSSRIGVKKTLPFMLGVLVGTFIVFIITGILSEIILDNVSVMKRYIGYIGAIYMTYLAFKIATSDSMVDVEEMGTKNLFFVAILLTLINPKAIIFGLTVTALYTQWRLGFIELLILSTILAVLCFIAVIVWGFFGSLFKTFLSKYQRLFKMTMATLLIFSGLLIILDTI